MTDMRRWKAKVSSIRAQRGDTLVEVLICILIVSMVLTSAYVTTNASALGIRDSQEHAEALKLVQSQLEQVRQNAVLTPLPAVNVFGQGDNAPFCMVGGVITTGTQCTRTDADQPAGANDQPAFTMSVRRTDCAPEYISPSPTSPCHKFTARAEWDSLVTKGRANEQITLRLYR